MANSATAHSAMPTRQLPVDQQGGTPAVPVLSSLRWSARWQHCVALAGLFDSH